MASKGRPRSKVQPNVQQRSSGRWTASIKRNGEFLGSRTFDTRAEATLWWLENVNQIGYHPNPAGADETLGTSLAVWLESRQGSVAVSTAKTDRRVTTWIPKGLLSKRVREVTALDVERFLNSLVLEGYAQSSITRVHATLSAYFAAMVRHGVLRDNPAQKAKRPRNGRARRTMHPFNRADLLRAIDAWEAVDADMAQVAKFMALTGLRWSETRALNVGDIAWDNVPRVHVRRSQPEGSPVKATKNYTNRSIPLAEGLLVYIDSRTAGRTDGEKLFAPLHRARFMERLDWNTTSPGRTLHDLRHTAICLWINAGIDLAVVRTWAGHADLTVTSRYVHWLGTSADVAAVDRLNALFEQPNGNQRGGKQLPGAVNRAN